MKFFLVGVSVLFFAIVSCNPVDEGQLPPWNASNLTTDQALQLLQGTWYLDRVEYITGPICAGGDNYRSYLKTPDLDYSGWKLEFNNDQMFFDGGNYTGNFSIQSTSDALAALFLSQYCPSTNDDSENEICIVFDYVLLQTEYFELGVEVIELNEDEMVLLNSAGSVYRYYYFKRQNSSSVPLCEANIYGTFVHDKTKFIQSGVVQSEQIITGGHSLEFTNQLISENGSKYYKCVELGGDYNANLIPLPTFLRDHGGIGYCATLTHLIGSDQELFSMELLNSTELILRNYSTCNDYEEYHLTKVN